MASVSSAAALSSRGARNLLQFLRLVGQLKRVPRTGWVYRNVQKPESVSDHMYRMAVMALVTKDEHLNKDRFRLNSTMLMIEIPQGIPLDEYETQSSAEAKFVKQLDQCEMILQASEYEDLENKPGRLQDFYDSTAGPGIVFFCVGVKYGSDYRVEPLESPRTNLEKLVYSLIILSPVFSPCRKIQSPGDSPARF
ncbi:HD domain-containing protein 2 [Camelus ferus]|nr:HD domain-containing protein 2 [Camelus ferus]